MDVNLLIFTVVSQLSVFQCLYNVQYFSVFTVYLSVCQSTYPTVSLHSDGVLCGLGACPSAPVLPAAHQ